jgi:uncharacterized protein DUF4337
MEPLETTEKIEGAAHASIGSGRRIGLLIAMLAALLALTEVGGKSAQTEALNANVQASDLWTFFQAKTVRLTTIRTAAELSRIDLLREPAPEIKAAIGKQIDSWNQRRAQRAERTGQGGRS